jgi:hypothetical protein
LTPFDQDDDFDGLRINSDIKYVQNENGRYQNHKQTKNETEDISEVRRKLIDLYSMVKIRKDDVITKMDDEKLDEEREKLAHSNLDCSGLIQYIKNSIEVYSQFIN